MSLRGRPVAGDPHHHLLGIVLVIAANHIEVVHEPGPESYGEARKEMVPTQVIKEVCTDCVAHDVGNERIRAWLGST